MTLRPTNRKPCFASLRWKNRRAFTLIEIMVVVALIAIIISAAIPSLYGFFHKEGFRKTVSDVVDSIMSARQDAIMHDKTADLVIHPQDLTCEASGGGSAGYGAWAHSAKFDHCTIEMLDVNMIDCKQADSVKVRFYPNGTSDEMTLVLRSDKNEWRTIALELTTGLPHVTAGTPKL